MYIFQGLFPSKSNTIHVEGKAILFPKTDVLVSFDADEISLQNRVGFSTFLWKAFYIRDISQ